MSATEQKLKPSDMKIGGKYNWKSQPDRLIYLGRNWSGNGYWHQFKKIGDPRPVWCEVLGSDLHMLEETRSTGATMSEQMNSAVGVWIATTNRLPDEGVEVDTKIDDHDGCRNQQTLKRRGSLWWFPDGSMYVYYRPTHWRLP